MHWTRSAGARGVVLVAALLLSLGWAGGQTPPETSCRAAVSGDLAGRQVGDKLTTFNFAVDVRAGESCATVSVDLIATEAMPSGETRAITSRHDISVDQGRRLAQVDHKMSTQNVLIGWDFRAAGCRRCGH